MRRGHTLIELVTVLAAVGVLVAVGFPHFAPLADGLAVDAAARRIVAMHQRGRVAAVLQGRTVLFLIDADSLRVVRVEGSDTVEIAASPGPAADGVTLTGSVHRVTWAPIGTSIGFSNATWHLARGDARRDVVVARLGRIRVVRPPP